MQYQRNMKPYVKKFPFKEISKDHLKKIRLLNHIREKEINEIAEEVNAISCSMEKPGSSGYLNTQECSSNDNLSSTQNMHTSAVFIDLHGTVSEESEQSTTEGQFDKSVSSSHNDEASHYDKFTKKINTKVKSVRNPGFTIIDSSNPSQNSEIGAMEEKNKMTHQKHGAVNSHPNTSHKNNKNSEVRPSKPNSTSLTENRSVSERIYYYPGVSQVHKCEICNEFFGDTLQFSDHSCFRSVCIICDISFGSKSERAEHLEKVHNNRRKNTLCSVCSSPLSQTSATCAKCNNKKTNVKEFTKKKSQNRMKIQNLPKHPTISSTEKISVKPKNVSHAVSKSPRSKVSLRKFMSTSKLLKWKNVCGFAIAKENGYKCPKCNQIFEKCSEICLHYTNCKAIADETSSVSKKCLLWLCIPCQLSFDRSIELRKHQKRCSVRKSEKTVVRLPAADISLCMESASKLKTVESKEKYWCKKCAIGCISPYSVMDHECEKRLEYMTTCYVDVHRLTNAELEQYHIILPTAKKLTYKRRHNRSRKVRQNLSAKRVVKQEIGNSPDREDLGYFQYIFQIKTENTAEPAVPEVLPHTCQTCQETFAIIEELDFHNLKKHGFSLPADDGSRRDCVKCKMHFSTSIEMQLHQCSAKDGELEKRNKTPKRQVVRVAPLASSNPIVRDSSVSLICPSQSMTACTKVNQVSINSVGPSSVESVLHLEKEKVATSILSQPADPQTANCQYANPIQLQPMATVQTPSLYQYSQNNTSPNHVLNNATFYGPTFCYFLVCQNCGQPHVQPSTSKDPQLDLPSTSGDCILDLPSTRRNAVRESPYNKINMQPAAAPTSQLPSPQNNPLASKNAAVLSDQTDIEVCWCILPVEKLEFVKVNSFDRPDAYAVKSTSDNDYSIESVERYICSKCYMSFLDKDHFATHMSNVHNYLMEHKITIQFLKTDPSKQKHAEP